jgi:hypothetical protein
MAIYPPRHVPRRLAIAALMTTVLLTLTGCLRLNMAVELLENDMANVQLDLAFQDEAIAALGMDPQQTWDSQFGDIDQNLPPGATAVPYPEEGWTGSRITMHNIPISDQENMNDLGVADLNIVRDGNYYVFQTRSDLGDEIAGSTGGNDEALEGMEMTFTLTCPGPIVESNGTITGNRVVWDLTQYTSDQPITARCAATAASAGHSVGADAGGFARWWPILLGALLTLAALAALAYFLRRKSHEERDSVPSNFGDTTNWQTERSETVHPYVAPHVEAEPEWNWNNDDNPQ